MARPANVKAYLEDLAKIPKLRLKFELSSGYFVGSSIVAVGEDYVVIHDNRIVRDVESKEILVVPFSGLASFTDLPEEV
jgi:hypothetical protein